VSEWIKVGDYYCRSANPDPVQAITMAELDGEITSLREQIAQMEANIHPTKDLTGFQLADALEHNIQFEHVINNLNEQLNYKLELKTLFEGLE
jgi:hypothetical protein